MFMKKLKSGKISVLEVIEGEKKITPPKELKLIKALTRFDPKEKFRRTFV